MTSNTDPIADAIGVSPMIIEAQPVIETPASTILSDIEYARTNMFDLLEQGHSMLNDLMQIAQQAQNAKFYEAATTLIRTMAQTNLDLIALQKDKKSLTEDKGPKIVNNNLTLTTNDLIKLIKKNGKTDE